MLYYYRNTCIFFQTLKNKGSTFSKSTLLCLTNCYKFVRFGFTFLPFKVLWGALLHFLEFNKFNIYLLCTKVYFLSTYHPSDRFCSIISERNSSASLVDNTVTKKKCFCCLSWNYSALGGFVDHSNSFLSGKLFKSKSLTGFNSEKVKRSAQLSSINNKRSINA